MTNTIRFERPAYVPDDEQLLIDGWLGRVGKSSRAGYQVDIAQYRAWLGRPLLHTTVDDLMRYRQSLGRFKQNTIVRKLDACCGFLRFAHGDGHTGRDVGREFRRLPASVGIPHRIPTTTEKVLTEDELQAVLAAEPDNRARALMVALYYSGMRVSEALQLDLRQMHQIDGGFWQFQVTRKGGYVDDVKIPGWLKALLDPFAVDGKPFPFSRQWAWELCKRAGRRIGVKVTPHAFRHSCGTHALYRGAEPHEVARMLGHRGLDTVMLYSHSLGAGPAERLNIPDVFRQNEPR